jgi:hypothetical protein
VRRIGKREGAALTIVENDVDVLAGLEADLLPFRWSLSRTRMTSWVSFSIMTTRAVYSWKLLAKAPASYSMTASRARWRSTSVPCLGQLLGRSALGW